MTALDFADYSGEDILYFDFAGLLMLQLATLIIGQELENYSIEFLEFYFNYYV